MVALRHHHQHHHKRYFARAAADCWWLWCVVARITHSINELCFPLSKLDWRIMWRFDVGWFVYCCYYCCWRCFSFLPFRLCLIFSAVIFNRTAQRTHIIHCCLLLLEATFNRCNLLLFWVYRSAHTNTSTNIFTAHFQCSKMDANIYWLFWK